MQGYNPLAYLHIDPLLVWLTAEQAEGGKALIPIANIAFVAGNRIYLKHGGGVVTVKGTFEGIATALNDILAEYQRSSGRV